MIGSLPERLTVNGAEYAIRADFRDVLRIIEAFSDADLKDSEKAYICLLILYRDFETIPQSDYEEAFKQAIKFIDNGAESEDESHSPRIMDWNQDEALLFPAINKVAGFETRAAEYIHWWTFLGYYMEITDGIFSNVISIRMKKAKGKPLEKWEREFWSANKNICALKPKLSDEELAEKERLKTLLS